MPTTSTLELGHAEPGVTIVRGRTPKILERAAATEPGTVRQMIDDLAGALDLDRGEIREQLSTALADARLSIDLAGRS